MKKTINIDLSYCELNNDFIQFFGHRNNNYDCEYKISIKLNLWTPGIIARLLFKWLLNEKRRVNNQVKYFKEIAEEE